MSKITYYLSILSMAFFVTSFQPTRLSAYISRAIPTTQAPVTHKSQLEALKKRGIAMVRPIDYGLSVGTRMITFLPILASVVTTFFEAYYCFTGTPMTPSLRNIDTSVQKFVGGVYVSVGLFFLYMGMLVLSEISSISFFHKGLLLPSHCLHRGFFGRLAHFFIPAAFAGVEAINYSQISYADLVVIRETISRQDATSGKKEVLWGVELQHTHRMGSQTNVFHRTLVIVLTDRRVYEVKEARCQGYNSFEMIVGMLQQKGIPIIHKRNY